LAYASADVPLKEVCGLSPRQATANRAAPRNVEIERNVRTGYRVVVKVVVR
jgi:hypothetical protein